MVYYSILYYIMLYYMFFIVYIAGSPQAEDEERHSAAVFEEPLSNSIVWYSIL